MAPTIAKRLLGLLLGSFLIFPPVAWATSVKLHYDLKKGATYEVRQLDHDKGESVSEINMMGTAQTHRSPFDRISRSRWTAHVTNKTPGRMVLRTSYGEHQGQDRLSKPTTDSGRVFGESKAEITIDRLDGTVNVSATPDDEMTKMLYTSRFIWLPALPDKPVKIGDGFSHEYRYKDSMMSWKGEDEYFLDEVRGNLAYFTVESKMVARYAFKKPDLSAMGNMEGMVNLPAMGDMTYVYQGEGSAIFDLEEGIFIEWETKSGYKIPTTQMGGITTTMRGVRRMRWELQRQ